MLNKVRKFLRDRSPDWLNTEVNKDLLQNLTANITSTPKTQDINSAPLKKGGWGDLNQPQDEVKRSQTKSDANNDRPLMTDDCSLNVVKGTPHWRRIRQVFQSLDNAPLNASYNQLIEYVKETTGKGCSRKLISKWKKNRQNSSLLPPREERNLLGDKPNGIATHRETNIVSVSAVMAINAASSVPHTQTIQPELSTVNSFQLNEPADNCSNDDSLNRPTLLPIKAWTYLTAAGMTITLVGCELLPLQISNNRLTENVAIASVTAPLAPLPPTPETRKNRLEPSSIKIELTLSNPQDLKVKPGDKVSAGQTLSDRRSERNRLQAKKKQLQLSLEKLNLPLTPIPKPRPIPEISSLPPVSYAEEEAQIKLKQQNLKEAENAIALQQKKIDSLNQLFTNSPHKPTTEKGNLKLVIEHEQANLKNLETAKQSAQIQLEVAQSQVTTAKENRAYIEYQRQLEQTRRAIAISQQHQSRAQTESERQILLAEREYSIAQIETQIQEIDYQIEQLSTVKAPYEGTIKKIKWTGQSDHNLTALVTLAVNDHRSTIANSTGKSTTTTKVRETREEDK
jgi:multidrug efflux pump subunit AcrA (membrane-fusion protein)